MYKSVIRCSPFVGEDKVLFNALFLGMAGTCFGVGGRNLLSMAELGRLIGWFLSFCEADLDVKEVRGGAEEGCGGDCLLWALRFVKRLVVFWTMLLPVWAKGFIMVGLKTRRCLLCFFDVELSLLENYFLFTDLRACYFWYLTLLDLLSFFVGFVPLVQSILERYREIARLLI